MKKKNFRKLNNVVNLKFFSVLGILTLIGFLAIIFVTQFIPAFSIGPICITKCGGGGGGVFTPTASEVWNDKVTSRPMHAAEGITIAQVDSTACDSGWRISVFSGGQHMIPMGSEGQIGSFLNVASGLGITFQRSRISPTGGCDGDNGECLLYGSIVLMSDETEKIIQDVKTGEFVKGMNKNGEVVITEVLDVLLDHLREGYYIINGELKITNDHPVLSEGLWIPVSQLKIGDKIKSETGTVKVETIEYVNTPEITAHLETQIGNFLTKGETGGTYLVKGWKSY